MFGHIKSFWIRPYILGGEDPKERSHFGLKIEFFHFYPLKFGLAWRKIEVSQGFWYQGVGLIFSFEIDNPQIPITIDLHVIDHFS